MNTQQKTVPIDKRYVHKANEENVLIGDVEKHGDAFHTSVIVNTEHPFFFEHPREHVPGLLLVEAGRQSSMAIVHKYYDVAFDKAFFINDFQMKFTGFATTSAPLTIKSSVLNSASKSKNYFQLDFEIAFYQETKPVASLSVTFTIASPKLLARLERNRG
ncbi:MAG: AfsA-related hotdog domain-containing protein [Campylobacterota bacterium]